MQPRTMISTNWNDPRPAKTFTTGVSLHSHTSASKETLRFIHSMGVALPMVARIVRHYEALSLKRYGIKLDFDRGYWSPPLIPRQAYELEAGQIQKLNLYPLVSITDHDTLEGTLLLRNLPSSRHIPMSVEWSAPFGGTLFHLGIHNLPSATGVEWMARFEAFSAAPDDATLLQMLRELHDIPQVLIILNHPVWDMDNVGLALHLRELRRLIASSRLTIHALELNGLRHARENRQVMRLARETGHLLISGGDRHGMEPNANINLTSASNFTEFVEEVRVDRISNVHYMDQYRTRWEQRIVQSTLNAVTDFPSFLPGWQKWDDRVFHPDANGEMRQLSQLWGKGHAPTFVSTVIAATRLFGKRGVAAPLSLAFPGVNDMNHGVEQI